MRLRAAALVVLLPCAAPGQELPTVASINLCTDQLVLTVAASEQILSLSWLSADPEESMLADAAREHALNYGSAEELIRIAPEVVVAGTETSPFTRQLARRLGFEVLEIAPAESLADIARNLRAVGAAIGRGAEAERAVAAMSARAEALSTDRDRPARSAIVVRPGGFTVGRGTLADELMRLAGLDNGAAALDRWGSLSIEALLASRPEVVVIADYRRDQASLANAVFAHPALRGLGIALTSVSVPSKYWACGLPESLGSAELIRERLR
jgi:iron complex transport system substrate-binding protein